MNEKRAVPPFSILTHANRTKTLVDLENGQAMHSRVGPITEANKVYADLAQIEKRLCSPTHTIKLYDVGMGTAANVLATLEKIRSRPEAAGRLEVFSFETKPEGLHIALETPEDFPWLGAWREPLLELLHTGEAHFSLGAIQIDWRLLIGDFYSHIRELSAPDYIYFDFYSPRVVPELWSFEKLKALRDHIGSQQCQLLTYSASTPTRVNLLLAGFFVGRGGSTGLKNETTAATTRLEDLEAPLGRDWFEHKTKTSSFVAESPHLEALSNHPQWTHTRKTSR